MRSKAKPLAVAAVAAMVCFTPRAARPDSKEVDPVLRPLLDFHPGWVTRSVTSHDPKGGNGDGSGNGIPAEDGYRVLFHGKGEGRIVRLWMTADRIKEVPRDYTELWIQLDGTTVYRGNPVDFFEGKGPYRAPLVLGYEASSQAYLSYVPFPYHHEAKVLFRSDPHYFQVTYREGPGSSEGPDAAQIAAFAGDATWDRGDGPPLATEVSPGRPFIVATGPTVLSSLSLRARPEDWNLIQIRIGSQPPVPAMFFFGLPSADRSAGMRSAVFAVDPASNRLTTRLPIPLQAGESLAIEGVGSAQIGCASTEASGLRSTARLTAHYRDQDGPSTETTMSFFASNGPTQLVSLVEEILGNKPGDRTYLEGDEMIRTDQMRYPLELGTGTEDYYNGGWYFRGPHANPFSGLPRFVAVDPENDWTKARFESSLYRIHVLDPIVGRSGVRFGFEAGPTGVFPGARYRTLALAYTFESPAPIATSFIAAASLGITTPIVSAIDAEASDPRTAYLVRTSRGRARALVACPAAARSLFLVRIYDAAVSGQEAVIRIDGREVNRFFEAYANRHRRIAEDAVWIPLPEGACKDGHFVLEIDSSASKPLFSDIAYKLVLYAGK